MCPPSGVTLSPEPEFLLNHQRQPYQEDTGDFLFKNQTFASEWHHTPPLLLPKGFLSTKRMRNITRCHTLPYSLYLCEYISLCNCLWFSALKSKASCSNFARIWFLSPIGLSTSETTSTNVINWWGQNVKEKMFRTKCWGRWGHWGHWSFPTHRWGHKSPKWQVSQSALWQFVQPFNSISTAMFSTKGLFSILHKMPVQLVFHNIPCSAFWNWAVLPAILWETRSLKYLMTILKRDQTRNCDSKKTAMIAMSRNLDKTP